MGSRLEKNSNEVRKRIESHEFQDEKGEEYKASNFGGFTDYMRRKKIKLQNLDVELRSQSTENPTIFRGIVAHVNGYTQPSLSDLHKLIVSHGGGFLQYLDGKTAVTHVIASNLTPKKKVEFARYRIVKPAWVVDSIKAGYLLPWDAYRVVDEGANQKVLSFDNGQIVSQANSQRRGYRDQTDTSWYTSHVRGIAEGIDGKAMEDEKSPGQAEEKLKIGQTDTGIHQTDADTKRINATLNESFSEGLQDKDFAEFVRKIDERNEDNLAPSNEFPGMEMQEEVPHEAPDEDHTSRVDKPKPPSPEKRQLTAEEHNAILLSNPHLAKSSTANPDFLNQYYRESRLHHLSAWKADLKAQLQARAVEKSSQQAGRNKRPSGARRYIMHVDFDSFFAAVSLRNNPQLKDKPVVIAHGSGPGSEIASCNYPAREYGIKNGMWMKYALELCPSINVLPYDFRAYEEASRHFYDSILAMDGIVQSISIDEALVDVSDQCIAAGGSDGKAIQEDSISKEQLKASELAQQLRALVREKTGCEVSVGIGSNILLAKVALRKAKPAGQYLIKPEDVLDFIGELRVTNLPGVAYSIGNKLEEIGVKYVKDIRNLTKERLVNVLGPKTGEKLWDYARGIDKVEVGEQVIRKSVSAEVNWGIRFLTQQQAEEFVQCLCDELHKRLLEQAVKGRQLTMKIMKRAADAGMDPPKNLGHGKCDTFNKSVILGVATNDKEVLGKEAISILRGYGFSPGELRGLGVQMQKLEPLKSLPTSVAARQDSSQRRLTFKRPSTSNVDINSGIKPSSPTPSVPKFEPQHVADSFEDIPAYETIVDEDEDETVTRPQKHDVEQKPKYKPLNISGTQFVLPSQIDSSVLAELPADVRSKLVPKQKTILDKIARPAGNVNPRSVSPYSNDLGQILPSHNQIDPEILDELPPELRAEILAEYSHVGQKGSSGLRAQQVLPQTPRKAQPTISAKKMNPTPTKKHKPTTMLGRTKSKAKTGSTSTLTQSNFMTMKKTSKEDEKPKVAEDGKEISESFLEEMPEDIRLEILAEQKRSRLKAKSGLNLGATRKKPRIGQNSVTGDLQGQRTVKLDLTIERPTFTSRKLSALPDLRDSMSAWVQEFSDEEPPFEEDVEALVRYLQKVITVEMDMAKAVAVVDWVAYLVTDQATGNADLHNSWHKVLSRIQEGVQKAVRERGLAPVDFAKL